MEDAAGKRGLLKVGTTIMYRSRNIPNRMPTEAITPVVIFRSLRMPSRTNGTTKFTNTISQKSVENRARVRAPKTTISLGSFPYQTVRCSAMVKYSQRMLIKSRSFARLLKWWRVRYNSRPISFRIAAITIISPARPLKIAPTTK